MIATASSVAGLAHESCRLAGLLYKFCRAVKEAPQCIIRLSAKFERVCNLLEEVDRNVKEHITSQLVPEDRLCTDSLQSLLAECQFKLLDVRASTAGFHDVPRKFRDILNRAKRALEEKQIEKHYVVLDEIIRRIGIVLSVAGR